MGADDCAYLNDMRLRDIVTQFPETLGKYLSVLAIIKESVHLLYKITNYSFELTSQKQNINVPVILRVYNDAIQ